MLFIPLPFVIALLLALLLMRLIAEGGVAAAFRPFFLLIGGYAVLSVLIGLRWGYGLTGLLPVMALMASVLPPLAWIAFSSLSSESTSISRWHALPALAVVCLFLFAPILIDWALVLIFVSYGVALLRLAARGPDALDRVPVVNAARVHQALIAGGIMLILSAGVDAAVALDFSVAQGAWAGQFVAVANALNLLILSSAFAIAGRDTAQSGDEPLEPEPLQPATVSRLTATEPPAKSADPTAADHAVLATVEQLVTSKQLFRDPELTLNRLARKAVLPARAISIAINRVKGQSVSHYINAHRVTEACRLLAETDHSVTAIMLESGFQTKSNFNREFRRQTGQSPGEWRTSASR